MHARMLHTGSRFRFRIRLIAPFPTHWFGRILGCRECEYIESTARLRRMVEGLVPASAPYAKLWGYLESLSYRVWVELNKVADPRGWRLPRPDVAVGPDGQALYRWTRGDKVLELQIAPSGQAEWYFKSDSGETWERKGSKGSWSSPPPEVLEKLRLFVGDAK